MGFQSALKNSVLEASKWPPRKSCYYSTTRRAFLYTLYTETPGRAFLEGRRGSKTSGCVFGFWSDIPLHNSEKHKKRDLFSRFALQNPKLKLT